MFRNQRKTLIAAVALATLLLSAPANAGAEQLSTARAATAQFHTLETAVAAGYGLFTDAAGIACIDKPGTGVMGIHYVKGALVGDAAVNAATPEALVYWQKPNGELKLAAVEYVVFKDAWDAVHSSPPSLFGQQFTLLASPNRYGLPAFYELHAWIWKNNPSGMFEDWNPRASCDDFSAS
ncbi:MAG TPA: hypothetical protein VGR87_13660 [Candidatus Limnocylindria bacterium]|jgi:hypothetical protein|nr:hypothetical protein [Candidatus Limnocylindria bacterium]